MFFWAQYREAQKFIRHQQFFFSNSLFLGTFFGVPITFEHYAISSHGYEPDHMSTLKDSIKTYYILYLVALVNLCSYSHSVKNCRCMAFLKVMFFNDFFDCHLSFNYIKEDRGYLVLYLEVFLFSISFFFFLSKYLWYIRKAWKNFIPIYFPHEFVFMRKDRGEKQITDK